MTRPATVVWSERLQLAGAALGLVREVLIWDRRVALDGAALAAVLTVGAPMLVAGLTLLATRRASRAALAALVLLTLLAWATAARLGLTDGSPAYTAGAVSLVLGTAGLLTLFTPAAWAWSRERRRGRA